MKDGEYTVKPQANVMNILTIPLTNKEILEKAIQKAIDGGYDHIPYSVTEHADFLIESKVLPILIYNHQFAKALWGDEWHHNTFIVPKELSKRFAGTNELDIKPLYMYHLQRMVISDDPIKYLKENI